MNFYLQTNDEVASCHGFCKQLQFYLVRLHLQKTGSQQGWISLHV